MGGWNMGLKSHQDILKYLDFPKYVITTDKPTMFALNNPKEKCQIDQFR